MSQWIAGQWVSGKGEAFTSTNPYDSAVLWEGNAATADQIDAAVKAARAASKDWMRTDLDTRIGYLKKYQDLLKENTDELARAIAQEVGKPFWEAKTEVASMISKIDVSIEAYGVRTGERITENKGVQTITRHKPQGVVAVLGPFNFPGHIPHGHIAPALLAGNTIVFKPSEMTPWGGELICKYWEEAGLPKGVLNCVQGGGETGRALSVHPDLNGLYFTGSYATGKKIHEAFASYPEKILALELGGNNPLIVDRVKDTRAAILNVIQSAFLTTGQRCTCARRMMLEKGSWGDDFIAALLKAMDAIKVGNPCGDDQPFMGTLISKQAAAQFLKAQSELIDSGATPLKPMTRLGDDAAMVTPGLIDITDMKRHDVEMFAPMLQVIRVDSFEQAIEEANNTRYGLSSAVLTDDFERFNAFYVASRAGLVNWNKPTTGAAANAPFGGTGYSGNHRPSAYYAADYCAFPVVSVQSPELVLPNELPLGLTL